MWSSARSAGEAGQSVLSPGHEQQQADEPGLLFGALKCCRVWLLGAAHVGYLVV